MIPRGLYETLVTTILAKLLAELRAPLTAVSQPLRPAEAADRIALHVKRVVQKALDDIPEPNRVTARDCRAGAGW